tara:strand:+ start:451 stop:975 length:525 start_codon:yes stop_codon:yes gene_type:complete
MPETDTITAKFQQIAKGSLLSSIENKHVQYISMADRRAQGILTISAVLIPFALSKIDTPQWQNGVIIFLLGAVITIISSVLCLMPKRFQRREKDRRHPLHFSGITQFTKEEYLERMATITQDTAALSREIAIDMYHLSHDVLQPKFRFLRISYISFVSGLCIGLGFIINGYLAP